MSFQTEMRSWWTQLTTQIFSQLQPSEILGMSLHAENSEFVRFNGCLVRQNTWVKQVSADFELQNGKRSLNYSVTMTGHLETDHATAMRLLKEMREDLTNLPENPLCVPLKNNGSSNKIYSGEPVPTQNVIQFLKQNQNEIDLAGIFCQGPLIRANKNSLLQDHWFETQSFYFDYSLYDKDRAVKNTYAGQTWDDDKFQAQVKQSQNFLSLMRKEKKTLTPGFYRAYLAPAATAELFEIIRWEGLSEATFRKGTNGFQKAARGEVKLSEKFSLSDNFKLGLSPSFNSLGEVSADEVPLFEKGQFRQFLTSTKSALEYNTASNQASLMESPRCPEIKTGTLQEKDVLKALGTGVYLSNLHYLNWSDRQTGRITGMTRYACFWVENGEIVSPIQDMRFDESLLHIFGSELVDLTAHAESFVSTESYNLRHVGGSRAPGLLISRFQFTL